MKQRNIIRTMAVITLIMTTMISPRRLVAQTKQAEEAEVTITIDMNSKQKIISPYIYGINDGITLKYTKVGAIRLGGNRTSAYNWENNLSNAGSDYFFSTDKYMINNVNDEFKKVPGGAALNVIADAKQYKVPYALLTLQMLGYVANGASVMVPEDGTAPNTNYWAEVIHNKKTDFNLIPDLEDNVVYTDEYLNYLINKVGTSENGGFSGYALDNEPSLWSSTHRLIQTQPIACEELVSKTIDLASVVKKMDSKADVFGPALYGYMAFYSLQDAPDWKHIKSEGGYNWFIDYYLDQMKQAEAVNGARLLDVLDLHYYSEAKGGCGKRLCTDTTDDCIKNRIDSVRSLWDTEYTEDSWITDIGTPFFPLLPNVQKSIDTYYPGTKLAFTEYDFGGGGHISGGIAETDFLGICAKNDVYFASLWSFDKNFFQLGAINMFTNYDGDGTGFGDMLITGTKSSDDYLVSAYAAYTSEEKDGTIRLIMTNKSIHDTTTVQLKLIGDSSYGEVKKYVLEGPTAGIIQDLQYSDSVIDNELTVTLSPLSVTELVLKKQIPLQENEAKISADVDTKSGSSIWIPVILVVAILLAGIFVLTRSRKNT